MTKQELKAWREEHMRLSMAQAAAELGMTQNAYRAMEKGTAGISKRTALACFALYIGADRWGNPPWRH